MSADPLLSVVGATSGYGQRRVLSDVQLNILPGEIVGVVGHNGAGKTTLLKTIFRIQPLTSGDIEFDGSSLRRSSNVDVVRRGISFTPAEHPVFRDLTVGENLELGAFTVRSRRDKRERRDQVLDIFSILAERSDQLAGTLSGGQQRQLSLGIALMARPRLMLLDEPSLGISPAVVERTFNTIHQLARDDGMSVLLVEQNVRAAAKIVDRVYVLRNGSIVLEESGEDAARRDHWWDLF